VKRVFVIVALAWLLCARAAFGGAPVSVEVIEVEKIWDEAPHSAFTDLVRWNGRFYCAFREGRGHVSSDGKIRVLESKDANAWKSANLSAMICVMRTCL